MVLIDNYDSFTYNIVHYFEELGVCPKVFKNDEITIEDLEKLDFEHLLISPGPGNPNSSGICMDAIKKFHPHKKILGVCLGHQCIAQFFCSDVVEAKEPIHGKTYPIYFTENPLFANLPQGFLATRYHSLLVENLSPELECIARTKDNIIMALRHRKYSVYGVQFHPESILTQNGKEIFKNFLQLS